MADPVLRAMLENEVRRVGLAVSVCVERAAADGAPNRTGKLAGSIEARGFVADVAGAEWAVVQDGVEAPHGRFIDDPAAKIEGDPLSFIWGGGERVYARSVVPSRVHEGWWDGLGWERMFDACLSEAS